MTPDQIDARVGYARSLREAIEREADETMAIALDLATTAREASAARTARHRTVADSWTAYRAVLAAAL
jgi:hypothetical protein